MRCGYSYIVCSWRVRRIFILGIFIYTFIHTSPPNTLMWSDSRHLHGLYNAHVQEQKQWTAAAYFRTKYTCSMHAHTEITEQTKKKETSKIIHEKNWKSLEPTQHNIPWRSSISNTHIFPICRNSHIKFGAQRVSLRGCSVCVLTPYYFQLACTNVIPI